MRLWSIHPSYLDRQGLVALWREALLAQKVLQGATKGYTHHPQLERFRKCNNPEAAIAAYLRIIACHAEERGYRFDKSKISRKRFPGKIPVTDGQIHYEFTHLLRKLKTRDPARFNLLVRTENPDINPVFRKVKGEVAQWEKVIK